MLVDGLGRGIEYLRLSVTDRCDLRCSYCMPRGFKDHEEPSHWLSFDEIERLLSAFARSESDGSGSRVMSSTGG
jgi:cyclic pyranopterin phosphate synthase